MSKLLFPRVDDLFDENVATEEDAAKTRKPHLKPRETNGNSDTPRQIVFLRSTDYINDYYNPLSRQFPNSRNPAKSFDSSPERIALLKLTNNKQIAVPHTLAVSIPGDVEDTDKIEKLHGDYPCTIEFTVLESSISDVKIIVTPPPITPDIIPAPAAE